MMLFAFTEAPHVNQNGATMGAKILTPADLQKERCWTFWVGAHA